MLVAAASARARAVANRGVPADRAARGAERGQRGQQRQLPDRAGRRTGAGGAVRLAGAARPQAAVLGPMLAATQLRAARPLAEHVRHGVSRRMGRWAARRRPSTRRSARDLDALVRAEPGAIIAEPAGFAVRNGLTRLCPADRPARRAAPGSLAQRAADRRAVQRAFFGGHHRVQLLPVEAERAIAQHFALIETLPSPDGLTFQVYRYQLADAAGSSRQPHARRGAGRARRAGRRRTGRASGA